MVGTRQRPDGTERFWTACVALVCSAVLAGLAHHARSHVDAKAAELRRELPVYLPRSDFLKVASLGYRNALADVLWFRTISYFGEHFRSDRLYPWLARMCDVVTDLDPRAEHVYRFAGLLLPWEAGDPDAGISLLKKGLRVFPDSWNLHFLIAFNYFFFRNDTARAIPHIRKAAELPGAHPFVSRLAALLYAEQYGPETAKRFLAELRESAGPSMRAVIEQRLLEIELGTNLKKLEDAVRRYRTEHGHNPATLDELVSGGLLREIPPEPFGGHYRYDPATGEVSSSRGHRPLRLYVSPRRQKLLRGERWRDL
ncbi:MAG: hypothetical protein KatS3mg076_1141 [Candidatus Binatia bacterium]|nr:MAG: hypothetical protein KatS3mg076_1141 [Candidatus Binatia bacterium]